MYKHFLITRFNLSNENWKITKKGSAVLTEEWLEHRFQLFETYCFPSVENQTNQNFIWLVYFDTNTPQIYQERALRLKGKNYHPKFIDGFAKLIPELKKDIKDNLPIGCEHIITSRLDNDDAIHKDYIKIVQESFVTGSSYILDIIDGYCLEVEPKLQLSELTLKSNPFISLVEDAQSFITVFGQKHEEWSSNFNINAVKDKRLFLQIIHNRNVSNDFRSHKYISDFKILESFGLHGFHKEIKMIQKIVVAYLNLFIKVKSVVKELKASLRSLNRKQTI